MRMPSIKARTKSGPAAKGNDIRITKVQERSILKKGAEMKITSRSRILVILLVLVAVTALAASTALAQADVRVNGNNVSTTLVHLGQNFSYDVQVANDGPQPATGILLTDTLPASTTFVRASGTGWSCSGTSP